MARAYVRTGLIISHCREGPHQSSFQSCSGALRLELGKSLNLPAYCKNIIEEFYESFWLKHFNTLTNSHALSFQNRMTCNSVAVHDQKKVFFFNFAFNMLWYSTPWTATPFSNDPLWLTLFVEDRLLDHCQVSSVPHYCAFKEQEIPSIYTVGMVIYWNSNVNILIFWDTDFLLASALSSNLQNKNKTF